MPQGSREGRQAKAAVGQLCRSPAPKAVGAHAGCRSAGLSQHLLGQAPKLTCSGDRCKV